MSAAEGGEPKLGVEGERGEEAEIGTEVSVSTVGGDISLIFLLKKLRPIKKMEDLK